MRQGNIRGGIFLAGLGLFAGLMACPAMAQDAQEQAKRLSNVAVVTDDQGQSLAEDFDITLSSISWSYNLNFDSNGVVNYNRGSMNLQMRFKAKGNAIPMQINQPRMVQAVTDSRETLEFNSQGRSSQPAWSAWQSSSSNSSRSGASDVYMSASFSTPSPSATVIKELVGVLDIAYAEGEPLEAVISPLSDYMEKRIEFKDLPGQYIRFTKSREGQSQGRDNILRVTMPLAGLPHVASVTFHDQTGQFISANGWGSGSDHVTAYRNVRIDLPEKGYARVVIYPKITTRTVRYVFRNLPLTPEVKGDEAKPDVTVELKPIGEAQPGADGKRIHPIVVE